MEPIPETLEALNALASRGDPKLAQTLIDMGRRTTALVPDCVGLSLTMVEEGVTFTLVASSESTAGLDAMQYLDGGPCEQAVETDRALAVNQDDLLDERRWQLYASAGAALGVASSLSLPILHGEEVVGGINLYASRPDAFVQHQEELASTLGASAADAVTNADLGFETRRTAREAPGRLESQFTIDQATGFLASRYGVTTDVARGRIRRAADRADIPEALVARIILETDAFSS